MSEISIWSPINQQDFWLPGVFYKGKVLRFKGIAPNPSSLPVSKTPVHTQKQSINQIPNSPPWPRPKSCPRMSRKDCRPIQGWNGLQDHRQATWWEGDNSWCDYSLMEETQNNCQSPSVWGSMQYLTSWSFNDHENGEESAQNYTGGSCQWSQSSWDHSHQENNW